MIQKFERFLKTLKDDDLIELSHILQNERSLFLMCVGNELIVRHKELKKQLDEQLNRLAP